MNLKRWSHDVEKMWNPSAVSHGDLRIPLRIQLLLPVLPYRINIVIVTQNHLELLARMERAAWRNVAERRFVEVAAVVVETEKRPRRAIQGFPGAKTCH